MVRKVKIYMMFKIDYKIKLCFHSHSEALSKALSALYCKLLVVLGLAFPITEVIAGGVPDGYYQV